MAALTEEEESAITQVGEVVEMAKEHGSKQPQLRVMAAEFFLGVSDSEKGRRALHAEGATPILLKWTGDMESVSSNAYGALVNLCADMLGTVVTAMIDGKAVDRVFETLSDDSSSARQINNALMLLANLTTSTEGCNATMQSELEDPVLIGAKMRRAVEKFVASSSPPQAEDGAEEPEAVDAWQHMATVLCNVTQLQDGRDLLRRRSTNLISRILAQLASTNAVSAAGVLLLMTSDVEKGIWCSAYVCLNREVGGLVKAVHLWFTSRSLHACLRSGGAAWLRR